MNNSLNIVVFAPHPDDEVLGCGGTMAMKTHEGYKVFVVIVTDGRNALKQVCGIESNPTPEELKMIRVDEAINALDKVGISKTNIFFLDFEDGRLNENIEPAKKKIINILCNIKPNEIYYPSGDELHPDHKATNEIILTSLKEIPHKPIGYQYSIWSKYGRFSKVISAILASVGKTVKVDISDYLFLKEKALKEYKSQTQMAFPKQEREILSVKTQNFFLGNNEYFIKIREANKKD